MHKENVSYQFLFCRHSKLISCICILVILFYGVWLFMLIWLKWLIQIKFKQMIKQYYVPAWISKIFTYRTTQ